jgi:pectate lyase
MNKILLSLIIIFSPMMLCWAQTPAFPGAEGGGMYTTGGRGGKVYYVNSLEDTNQGDKTTGEGTLRWCLYREGPKTILFKVAGIIHLKAELNISGHTTIAGQTAPGDGICIADNIVKVNGNNVIVRYLRFRLGDLYGVEDDTFKGIRKKDIIIDHCSMSWSTDECASFYDNENFTLQWCILSESLRSSVHQKGDHGYGGIWGGKKASFHHNLLAHHDSRNPRMCGSRYSAQPELELVDFRNNVIYNWGANSGYAGEGGRYNFINNYYKPSKYSSHSDRIFTPNADIGANRQKEGVWGTFYLSGNYNTRHKEVCEDNLVGFHPNPASKNKMELISATPFETAYVTTDDAEKAYEKVLKHAGASLKRDSTDARIIDEVAQGLTPVKAPEGSGTPPGMINSQKDVGGWETYGYDPSELVVDADRDGIPDEWLKKHYPGKSANDFNKDGYTYLEVYLNSLVKMPT